MSTKHTPGKWYADIDGECANVRHEDGGLIAQCTHLRGRHGLGGRRSAEEVAANARLFAAAPGLLAVARKALDAWTGDGPPIDLDELRAAIAKATGAA